MAALYIHLVPFLPSPPPPPILPLPPSSHSLPLPWGWWFADKLFFGRVQEALGLGRCHIFLSGAAPIREQVVEYFMGVNIPILEIYGMSESTGSHSVNFLGGGRWRVGSAGRALNGVETKIESPDVNSEGEVSGVVCRKSREGGMGGGAGESERRW